MQYKTIPWSAIHTHVTLKSLIESVSNKHLNTFPERFFKRRFLDDKRSIQNLYKDDKFVNELKLPFVSVGYEINDDPRDTLESVDFPYNYPSHFVAGRLSTYYWKLYDNPISKTQVYAAFVRKKITLTFKYLFPDVYQRDDVYIWMLNNFRYNGPPDTLGLHRGIDAIIPSNMLEYLAAAQGNTHQSDSDVADNDFFEDLHRYSRGLFFKRKVNMESSTEMWMMKYEIPHMQIIQSQRPNKDDGEQRGQIKTNFGIEETLEFEPYVPQMYISQTPSVINGRQIPDVYKPASIRNTGIDDRLLQTRNYTINPISRDIHKSLKDFEIISDIEFTGDHVGEEIIDIDGEIYGPMHLDLIKILLHQNKDPNDYYRIFLYAFDTKLTQDVDFSVDWKNMKIRMFRIDERTTYRLVGTSARKTLHPYIQNLLVHNEEEYYKLFPKEKADDSIYRAKLWVAKTRLKS